MISHVLKGEKVELQDGITVQDGEQTKVGEKCLAPWQGQLYEGLILAVSSKMTQF